LNQQLKPTTKAQVSLRTGFRKDCASFVRKKTQINGQLINFWDVMLGDMRVKETSK